MKKLLLIILIAFSSCAPQPNTKQNQTNIVIPMYKNNDGVMLNVVSIEGCEYFTAPVDRSVFFTHKGNCKNQIHYQNK